MDAVRSEFHSILATDRLTDRTPRAPNYELEAEVMGRLGRNLSRPSKEILQILTEAAVTLCGGTGGVSLIEDTGPGPCFRWVALAGELYRFVGGKTDRHASPCGVTLSLDSPQLFIRPGRCFPDFAAVDPPIVEGLVIPFYRAGRAVGTIWVVSHSTERQLESEDVRIMSNLGAFAAAALELGESVSVAEKAERDARSAAVGLEQANAELKALAADLSESNSELDRFNRAVTGHLTAPLNSIGELLDSFDEDFLENASRGVSRRLHLIAAQASRMRKAIDELARYSRVQGGSDSAAATEIYLSSADAIASAIRRLRPASSAAVQVESYHLPIIAAAPAKFAMLLDHILHLGFAVLGPTCEVRVCAEETQGVCIFSIRCGCRETPVDDTPARPGKPPFPPSRIPNADLNRCRRLAQELGGLFWTEPNDAVGRTFLFTVPAR